MKRTSVSHMQVERRDGTRRHVKVVRQALRPIVLPVIEAVYVLSGGFRHVEARPLAREVADLLRGRSNFPNELRSDR